MMVVGGKWVNMVEVEEGIELWDRVFGLHWWKEVMVVMVLRDRNVGNGRYHDNGQRGE